MELATMVEIKMDTEDLGASLFMDVLEIKSPLLKVLDYLMDNKIFDYSKTDIARGAGISRATLFSIWPKLEAFCLVMPTREIGRAKMYKLNMDSPIVKKLIELDNAISDYYATKYCDIDGDITGVICKEEVFSEDISGKLDKEKPKKDSVLLTT
jgi:hypothetical protein